MKKTGGTTSLGAGGEGTGQAAEGETGGAGGGVRGMKKTVRKTSLSAGGAGGSALGATSEGAVRLCLPRMVTSEERKDGKIIGQGVRFERIRRITGYLVGTLDRFNDGKRAEERDRVKHVNMEKLKG